MQLKLASLGLLNEMLLSKRYQLCFNGYDLLLLPVDFSQVLHFIHFVDLHLTIQQLALLLEVRNLFIVVDFLGQLHLVE